MLIIGAGGHSKTCLEVLNSTKKFQILGFLDKKIKKSKFYEKFKIFQETEISKILKLTRYAHVGLGQIKSPKLRTKLFQKFKTLGFKFPALIHSSAHVSKYSSIKEGALIGINVIINANSKIGINTIINNKSLIEHDTTIGDHCHISTSVIINGNCSVGNNTFVGSGAIIFNNIKIGKNCIIGSGEIVKKNLKDGSILK